MDGEADAWDKMKSSVAAEPGPNRLTSNTYLKVLEAWKHSSTVQGHEIG